MTAQTHYYRTYYDDAKELIRMEAAREIPHSLLEALEGYRADALKVILRESTYRRADALVRPALLAGVVIAIATFGTCLAYGQGWWQAFLLGIVASGLILAVMSGARYLITRRVAHIPLSHHGLRVREFLRKLEPA